MDKNTYIVNSGTVEAFKYDGDFKTQDGEYYVPAWAPAALEEGKLFFDSEDAAGSPCQLFACTPIGVRHVAVGNYIARDSDGDIYTFPPTLLKSKFSKINIGVDLGSEDTYIDQAIRSLIQFRDVYCLDEASTESADDLIFRCNKCPFKSAETGECSLKIFLTEHGVTESGIGTPGGELIDIE